jgi:hypothetical protein
MILEWIQVKHLDFGAEMDSKITSPPILIMHQPQFTKIFSKIGGFHARR